MDKIKAINFLWLIAFALDIIFIFLS